MSMLETSLLIGGSLRQSHNLSAWEVHALQSLPARSGREEARTGEEVSEALSTCHNSPCKVTTWSGASLMTVKRTPRKKQEQNQERLTSKRGNVTVFSSKSRKRLMNTLAMVKRDNLPCFVTLTYPAVYSDDPAVWKAHLDAFLKRLNRKFPNVSGVWKLEPQKREAPHFHLLVWGVFLWDLMAFVPTAWYEVVGSGDVKHLLWHQGALRDKHGKLNKHCVSQVESQRGVFWYASKYMSKDVSGWSAGGRWWGVFYRSRLPLGEVVNVEVSEQKAIEFIRYMRRYMKRKGKKKSGRDYRSLTVICNPDFWVSKLL